MPSSAFPKAFYFVGRVFKRFFRSQRYLRVTLLHCNRDREITAEQFGNFRSAISPPPVFGFRPINFIGRRPYAFVGFYGVYYYAIIELYGNKRTFFVLTFRTRYIYKHVTAIRSFEIEK